MATARRTPARRISPPLAAALPKPLVTFAAACLVGAATFAFFGHSFLNYDTFYALEWGKQLAHGTLPQYNVSLAPTPHPLAIAIGVPLSLLGDSAEQVSLALVLLAIGFICLALYRLGSELYAWPVGLLAAAIAATRVPLLNFGIRGYVDLPTIALVLWAAVLESRRPRRGAPVLALLTLAGLLRPEAWLFAAAYWLWMAPAVRWRERVRLAALAAAAPVIWVISDAIVTGDALWSLHGTHDVATQLHRKTGLASVPSRMPRHLGEILRLPELVSSVVGFAAGLVWFRRRTLLPAAIAVLNGLTFLVFAAAHLPLITRYLFLAATVLALFAAIAAFGWLALPASHPARRAWRLGGAVVFAAILAFTPTQVGRLRSLRADIVRRERVQSDLHSLVRDPAAAALVARCRAIFVPNHGQVPLVAYWSGRRPAAIASAELRQPSRAGVYLSPANAAVARLAVLDPHDPRRFAPPAPAHGPPGYREVGRNRSWFFFAAGCPGA